ncbi:MAG: DUF2017 family protein [Actinobacteria bacterium]|nr:DUF2017 family protein [Actinomycetota bacterium]
MIFRGRSPVRRTSSGVVFAISDDERRLIGHLLEEFRAEVDDDPDQPDLRRLFPTAYPDDPMSDAAYQLLARSGLRAAQDAACAAVERTLWATTLDDDELSAWMTTVNRFRLVLGTRLDVAEGDHDVDPDEPHVELKVVYHYLSSLLSLLVEAAEP